MEEERTIIKSKRQSLMKFNIILIIIAFVGVIAAMVIVDIINDGYYDNIGDVVSMILVWSKGILLPALALIGIINLFFYISKYSITVTNKAIYGRAFLGREVLLPMDSVTAVGKTFLKGISVATSSGKIHFFLIANANKIYSVMNKLITERQGSKPITTVTQNSVSNADELRKYKDLLNDGVITQEEFDAKKRQILGI